MKLYRRIVIDMTTYKVLEADEFEYRGPIAECKGGGTSKTYNYDKAYNRRMAAIAERQQSIADQYFDYWKDTYAPYEKELMAANLQMLPIELESAKIGLESMKERAEFESGKMQWETEERELAKPVVTEYYKEALAGVDPEEEARMARADVAQEFEAYGDASRREASRLGIDPNSGAFASRIKSTGLEKAKAVGSAMTGAKRWAETENYQRLQDASKLYKGGIGAV